MLVVFAEMNDKMYNNPNTVYSINNTRGISV